MQCKQIELMLVHQFWLGHIQSLLARRVANHEPEHQFGIMVKKKVFLMMQMVRKFNAQFFFLLDTLNKQIYICYLQLFTYSFTLLQVLAYYAEVSMSSAILNSLSKVLDRLSCPVCNTIEQHYCVTLLFSERILVCWHVQLNRK